ncbi:hypothetical protein E4T56_gene12560 [Termitomyces sp. T112]|nr:hypothetical protein E4T56_gene12560 [Termitomyces sp. T112]KAH0582872.1 hypothetical protein H2248_010775 [Termitomyces sp. 'cryptogamus']
MGLLPFSLSYLMLTPRRIQLPTDTVPQTSRKRVPSVPASPTNWKRHLTFGTKSLRSFRGMGSSTSQGVDGMGEGVNDQGPTTVSRALIHSDINIPFEGV